MANDQHSLSSFFKSAYFWIFIVSFIICILSVFFGHKDCSDWNAGDETCWGNEYLHNVYKIGFLVGVISGFPVAIKLLPYLWRKALLWSKNSQLFREFGWLLLILVIALYPYHMVTNPDCYGDDDDFTGCEEGTFDSNISVAGLLGFVFSLIILGATGSGDDDEIPQDRKWWILFCLVLIGWVCYWIVSSIIGSEFGEVIGEMFAKSPVLMSCMTIGLIVLIVISDWSGADSDVTVSKDSLEVGKRNKGSDGTNCVRCGANILSNHAGVKATKVAFYTPVTSWIGATVGMAVGGFAGLFAGSLIGGAKGAAKGLEHDLLCSDCRYK